ncbi:hypothetical protein GTO10_06720 [Candidatus Saccharibacteria bacterium]|nr:hypothetical protein [Candidatus Saccharibacteria bacterium]
MGKRTKKEKERSRERRKLEVLRAQTTDKNRRVEDVEEPKKKTNPETEIQRVDPKYIKKDLVKAGILTALFLGIIVMLYALKDKIPFF